MTTSTRTRFPRRVDTGVLRSVSVVIPWRARRGLHGNGFNYWSVSGQGLYAMHDARKKHA